MGLSMFIYCELRVGRGIPGDAPVRPSGEETQVNRGKKWRRMGMRPLYVIYQRFTRHAG